jgi:hypothetical protein
MVAYRSAPANPIRSLAILSAALLLLACGTASQNHPPPAGDLDFDASYAGDAGPPRTRDASMLRPPCDASSCTAPMFCSAAGVCMDVGTCAASADCDAGMSCDLQVNRCILGGDCGAQQMAATAVKPNLLIVLDRSCSMLEYAGGNTKWKLAVVALDTAIANTKNKLRFGLILFPDMTAPECGQTGIPVPVGDQGAGAISALLDRSLYTQNTADWYPGDPCMTPIDAAMALAATDPSLGDSTRQSSILLVTDGQQTCGPVQTANAALMNTVTTLNKTKHVSTYVLGFGDAVDPTTLTELAVAGGKPNAGSVPYYSAQNAAGLATALGAIAARASLSCSLALDNVPPNATKLYVFANKQNQVTRDATHSNGWDYDSPTNRIVFYGAACNAIQNGSVTRIDVVFGCPQLPVN